MSGHHFDGVGISLDSTGDHIKPMRCKVCGRTMQSLQDLNKACVRLLTCSLRKEPKP